MLSATTGEAGQLRIALVAPPSESVPPAAYGGCAFLHSQDAQFSPSPGLVIVAGVEALAVVLDAQRCALGLDVQENLHVARLGVPVDVGHCLLDDPVEGFLHLGGKAPFLAGGVEPAHNPGAVLVLGRDAAHGRDQTQVVERDRPQLEHEPPHVGHSVAN